VHALQDSTTHQDNVRGYRCDMLASYSAVYTCNWTAFSLGVPFLTSGRPLQSLQGYT
jgi:hypothetical protein